MMIALVGATGLLLLTLPALTRMVGGRVSPRTWAFAAAIGLTAGALLVVTALFLTAAPVILEGFGRGTVDKCFADLRRAIPGGLITSIGALVAMSFACVQSLRTWARGHRLIRHVRRAMTAGSSMGEVNGYSLVVLPDDRHYALSVPWRRNVGSVVLSQGIVDLLPTPELEVVVLHEIAHLRRHHRRFLVLALLVEHAMWFWPPTRISARILGLAVECWADEIASGDRPASRANLRRALLATTGIAPVASMAAFGAADGLAQRLEAIEAMPGNRGVVPNLLLLAPLVLLGLVASFSIHSMGHDIICMVDCLLGR